MRQPKETWRKSIRFSLSRSRGSDWDFIKSTVHSIAYLLDPRKAPFEFITGEEREMAIESICSYNKAGQDEADEVYSEYLKYTIFVQDMPMKIPRLHSSLSSRKISLSDFWKGRREEFPRLSKLALVACSLVCSTSSAERNFSLQGLIQSIVLG
jgi:hypothetical protein